MMRLLCLALVVILVSAAALVSSHIMQQVSVDFYGNLTLTCDLTPHRDLLEQGPVNVSWESMGKDVVQYDGDLHVGPLYENRISAVWDDGKLNFTLRNVVMSDADIYECLWHGWKTLQTVMVSVAVGYSEHFTYFSNVNDDAKLPCFGKIPRSKTLEKVSVYWKKDGEIIYSLIAGKPSFTRINASVSLHRIVEDGDLSLYIDNLSVEDGGIYECLYRDNSFGAEVHGLPLYIQLIVEGYVTPTEIEPFGVITSTSPSSYLTTTGITSTTGQEEVNSQEAELSPESSPDSRYPNAWLIHGTNTEETLPWVRIGIICGVLVITALILGPLVAMGKI